MGVYGTTVVIGATPVVAGTSGRILYNNAGAVGEMTTTGSGTVVALATGPTFPTTITVGAAAGATGTVLLKGTTSGTVTLSVADAAGTWTMKLPTTDGNSGEFLQTDGSGNTTWAVASGGAPAFSAITSGTNTTAAMVVGTGASLATSGSGTIAATSVPASGISGNIPVTNLNGGTGASSSTFWRGDGTWASAGGGGSIGGTIANQQVAVGTGTNTIGGSSALTWDGSALFAQAGGGATSTSFGADGDIASTVDTASDYQFSAFNTAVTGQASGGFWGWRMDSSGRYALDYATDTALRVTTAGVSLGDAGGNTGVAIFNGTTSGAVTLSVADAAGTWTMKLPTTDGNSGEFLQTDGNGVTTWASAGGGITIGTTTITSGTSTRILYDNAGVVGEYTLTGTGTVVAMQTSPTLLTTATVQRDSVGVTSADGVILTNTTAAAAGAQQYSPRLRLTGQGWKTNATAASQTVDWVIETQPVQGAASPSANLVLLNQVNGGGYSSFLELRPQGQSGTTEYYFNVASGNRLQFRGNGSGSSFDFNAQNINGRRNFVIDYGGAVQTTSTGFYCWSSSSTDAGGTIDLWLYRGAAAVLQMGQDVNGAAVAQTFQACNGITGTDKTGADLTVRSGKGTGAGAVSSYIVQTPTLGSTGTTAQTQTTRLTIKEGSATYTVPKLIVASGTAIPAGGTAGTGYTFSSTSNFGVFFGSGAPSLSAAKGSLYLRSDGTTTNDRAYINTDGSTTWTALTTAA